MESKAISPDEVKAFVLKLANQHKEKHGAFHSHVLILAFGTDENGASGPCEAWASFGHDDWGMVGCANMLLQMALGSAAGEQQRKPANDKTH